MLISVHDVMPETMDYVKHCLSQLSHIPPEKITLLVVPSKDWHETELCQLREWQQQGFQLAGHGWEHLCDKPRNLHHKLHSLFISRNVAEHLSRSEEQIEHLLQRCHDWFAQNQLIPPSLYVPPAWAMGNLSKPALLRSPFQQFESLHSLIDLTDDRQYKLPLTGFEADTVLRAWFLRCYNKWNRWRALHKKVPLRISIHPYDFNHMIAGQLHQFIHDDIQPISYDEIKNFYL